MHAVTAEVTERIAERSRDSRAEYLARVEAARHSGPGRGKLSCANWAHAFAASPDGDKTRLRDPTAPNVASAEAVGATVTPVIAWRGRTIAMASSVCGFKYTAASHAASHATRTSGSGVSPAGTMSRNVPIAAIADSTSVRPEGSRTSR